MTYSVRVRRSRKWKLVFSVKISGASRWIIYTRRTGLSDVALYLELCISLVTDGCFRGDRYYGFLCSSTNNEIGKNVIRISRSPRNSALIKKRAVVMFVFMSLPKGNCVFWILMWLKNLFNCSFTSISMSLYKISLSIYISINYTLVREREE